MIADPATGNKQALLRAIARQVQRLGGLYWTAIDIGVDQADADIMAEECDYIFARASEFVGDDPAAHYTALGGFHGIRAVAKHIRGTDDLTGVRVAVQGAGQTGADLIAQLVDAGADVVAADIDERKVEALSEQYGIGVASPDEIHAQEVDIFAPCAMGGILNDQTIPDLKCSGIAGLANNQLDKPEHGEQLLGRNIAYAPDFIVNAGGMMRAGMPIFAAPDPDKAAENIAGLFETVGEILRYSTDHNIPTETVAESIARERISAAQASSARQET